jgi:ArsR family transcriptional regulator
MSDLRVVHIRAVAQGRIGNFSKYLKMSMRPLAFESGKVYFLPVNSDTDMLAKQLWALGDAARLRIIAHLPRNPDCKFRNNVTHLAEDLGIPQPTLSHHLRVLRQAGLVSNKRMCRDVFYWLDEAATDAVAEALCRYVSERAPGANDCGGAAEPSTAVADKGAGGAP